MACKKKEGRRDDDWFADKQSGWTETGSGIGWNPKTGKNQNKNFLVNFSDLKINVLVRISAQILKNQLTTFLMVQ